MTSIRILGIGSPFGDDRLGWMAIDLLIKHKKIKALNNCVYLEKTDRPGLNLLTLLHDAKTVFLVDAVKLGAPLGTIHRLENREIERLIAPVSTHQIGIGEALRMGRMLNQIPDNIILYGVEIAEVCIKVKISSQVSQALKTLVEQLAEEIAEHIAPPS